jgi:hypothetical protein
VGGAPAKFGANASPFLTLRQAGRAAQKGRLKLNLLCYQNQLYFCSYFVLIWPTAGFDRVSNFTGVETSC